jgi:hypothetical protein
VENLRRIQTIEVIEGKKEVKLLEELKEVAVTSCCRRASSTQKNILFKISWKFSREEMDGRNSL